jgi:hypothetical protein
MQDHPLFRYAGASLSERWGLGAQGGGSSSTTITDGGRINTMAVYVGFRDEDPKKRIASTSLNKLRAKMRKRPGSEWLVAKFVYRWREDLVVKAITNPLQVPIDEVSYYYVTDGGRVQKGRRRG